MVEVEQVAVEQEAELVEEAVDILAAGAQVVVLLAVARPAMVLRRGLQDPLVEREAEVPRREHLP
jgi:hypothetical protein